MVHEGCESNDKSGVADKVTSKKFLLCLTITVNWTVNHDNLNDNNPEKFKNLFLLLAFLFLT